MNVAENLYDYLKNNDKAELIGFGTFYVKTSSATINELTGNIEPPKREIFFTKQQDGDRSFVSFMATNEFISEQTAYTWIKQYSDSLNEKIQSGRSITLAKIGKIEKGLLEDYTFTADNELNLLDSSFALGTLTNVQTFDSSYDKIDVIQSKTIQEEISKNTSMPQEFENQKSEIELQIEQVRKLKEEDRIDESEKQTEQRIIQHSEAEITSSVEKPENRTETEVKINIDNSTKEDKLQQTIDRAAEFKENVVIEDIKPANKETEKGVTKDNNTQIQEDVLRKQALDIVNKHSKNKTETNQTDRNKQRKRSWLVLFWIVIALLLLFALFVFAHWMGFLKDIKVLKPITDRISYYIPVKEQNNIDTEKPFENPMVETITEETYTGEIEYDSTIAEEPPVEVNINKNTQIAKKTTTKKAKKKDNKEETVSQPEQEKVVEDNSPIIVQNHSKLGFDVVSGSFADKSKAEEQARKARRLGYDGYVISKIKGGSPIYYVSYGSRRTNSEATDLCTLIKNRLGGNFYIISR